MDHYNEETYGERIAGVYDDWFAGVEDAMVGTLHELAQDGRALELGVGTGRIALPLAETGVEVHGIDASEAMLSRLRAKPGGEKIVVKLGNFGDVAVDGQYSLIYVVFNTFFGLLSQEEQVRCFQNVASHLTPNGVFVIEAFVPDLNRYERRQKVSIVHLGVYDARLDLSQIDPVTQQIHAQSLLLSEGGIRLFPVRLRYAWPAELDLMARIAGLRLQQRWSNWDKAAFTSESGKHISVYELAAG